MPKEIDLAKYSKLFVSEARENLRSLNEAMIELEANPRDKDLVESMFRACHTIKGMAGMMNFKVITDTSHALEDLLNAIRNDVVEPKDEVAEAIFKGLDALDGMIGAVERAEEIAEAQGLVDELRNTASGKPSKGRSKKPKKKPKKKTAPPQSKPVPPNRMGVWVKFGRRCAFPSARAVVIMKELG